MDLYAQFILEESIVIRHGIVNAKPFNINNIIILLGYYCCECLPLLNPRYLST